MGEKTLKLSWLFPREDMVLGYLIPSDMPRQQLNGVHEGEMATLRRLRDKLPKEYRIYHGLHWSGASRGLMSYGEVDFVIASPTGDMLLIEQKNGALIERDGHLVKDYGDGAKNVAFQIERSVNHIREALKSLHGRDFASSIKIDYLIYLPDYRVRKVTAIGIDATRLIDAAGDSRLEQTITALLPAAPVNGDKARRLQAYLDNTIDVIPDIHAHAQVGERGYLRLAGGLTKFIDGLEMTPWRLRVVGPAGCGKSLLALRTYRRTAAAGKRPLLLCYNRPIADRLRAAVAGEQGMVNTWHGFLSSFLRQKGVVPDYARSNEPGFWEGIADAVVGADGVPPDWRFDTIIIDEAQDFQQEWLEILGLFATSDQPDILWLEDPRQNIYRRRPLDLPGFVTLRLTDSFRTPYTIGQYIKKLLPFDLDLANPTPGLGVTVKGYGDEAERDAAVAAAVTELRASGFAADDIVIVALSSVERSAYCNRPAVGSHRLKHLTGYDSAGNQLYSDGDILCDSVYRFKGQQAAAVILVEMDGTLLDDAKRGQRLLFTALTRATVKLVMISDRNSADHGRLVDACY